MENNIFENAVSFEDIKQYGKNKTDKVYLHIKFVNKLLEKYQEPIDEDKLNEFANNEELIKNVPPGQGLIRKYGRDCYKAGYHKAMEE